MGADEATIKTLIAKLSIVETSAPEANRDAQE
jgi:hypothetical protein